VSVVSPAGKCADTTDSACSRLMLNAEIRIYIFQVKYTEAISSNIARKLLWFEITEMLIAVTDKKIIVSL